MTRRWRACSVLAVALAVSACDEDAPASAPVVPRVPKADAAPSAAVASAEYSYNPVGKRDPFRDMSLELSRVSAPGETPEQIGCTDPLCQVDLDELTVVAVISGDNNPVAMLEDRGGVGHIVRRNSKVGRQGGKVTQIFRDCVVVTSFVTGPDGKAQPNKSNKCVRADVRSAPVLDLLEGKLRQ